MKRCFSGILWLLSLSIVAADTWQCWSTYTQGPQLAPASVTTACSGMSTGGVWTQTATYQVQPKDLQNQALGTSSTIAITAKGVCTDVFSPWGNYTPTFQPPVTSYVGSNLQWYVTAQGWVPSMFNFMGSGNVVWSASLATATTTTHNWTETPCTCLPADCANGTAKSQCTTTCGPGTGGGGGGTQCSLPLTACGSICYLCGAACGTGGQEACCSESQGYVPCCTAPGGSPILVDPAGQGFHLQGPANMVAFRNHAADTKITYMDWTDPAYQNAWLVLPVNGVVRGLDQMVGNLMMPQAPSANPNGYLALAEYDKPDNGGNGDGVIGPEDAIWRDGGPPVGIYTGVGLRLWVGRPNASGASNPADLHRPEELGVYGFALGYAEVPKTDAWGNQFRFESAIFLDPGRTHKDTRSYDVFPLAAR